MMGRTHFRGLCCLLENTGGIPKTAPAAGARGGGHRLGWNEVQILIIWNLIQVIPILEQLAAHILVHLLRAGENCKPGCKAEITFPYWSFQSKLHPQDKPTNPWTIGGSTNFSYLCLRQQHLSQYCPGCTVLNLREGAL